MTHGMALPVSGPLEGVTRGAKEVLIIVSTVSDGLPAGVVSRDRGLN